MITRQNYETFFLDYIEGNLEPGLESQLLLFMDQNPDLGEELRIMQADTDVYGTSKLHSTELLDSATKNSLKKSELPVSYDKLAQLIIGRMEGHLDTDDLLKLEQLEREHAEVRREVALFALTKLNPEASESGLHSILHIPSSIDLSHPEMMLIAKMEGDLSPSALTELNARIATSNELQMNEAALLRSRLHPGKIVFENKKSLYQKTTGRVIPLRHYFGYAAAAASVALLVWFSSGDTPERASYAGRMEFRAADLKVNTDKEANGVATVQHPGEKNKTDRNYTYEKNTAMASVDSASDALPDNSSRANIPTIQYLEPKNASAFAIKHHGPELAPDMEKLYNDLAIQRSNTPVSAHTGEMSVWEFAEKKAKEKVWGGTDYPEDKFALALVQKEMDHRLRSDETKMQVESIVKPSTREFRVQIGKFKYSRKRNTPSPH